MREETGYSLLEVVAALAILAILAVPLTSLLTQGHLHYRQAGCRTRSAALAAALLEELKGEDYTFLQETLLNRENEPSPEYPYVTGRNNFYQGDPCQQGIFPRLHLLEVTMEMNQNPRVLDVLLMEILDGRERVILTTLLCGWQK